MERQYRAFLLRCWDVGDEQRFEIAHIQSGDSIRANTLAEVIAWIDTSRAPRPPAADAPDTDTAADAPPTLPERG